VKLGPIRLPLPLLLWFGVLAAPIAWTLQHIFGFGLTQATCNVGGSPLPIDGWTLAATIVATIVAVLGGAAAVAAYLATRDAGTEIPGARINFLATTGIVIAPIFLAIVLMSGISVLVLPECHQS
jgi:hypothetical protein